MRAFPFASLDCGILGDCKDLSNGLLPSSLPFHYTVGNLKTLAFPCSTRKLKA